MKIRTIGNWLAAVPFAAAPLQGQTVKISPGYTSIGVNATLQYTATVTGLTPATVTWKVNSITGGNSTYGTITTGGLYKAPATIPANGITITALGSDNKTFDIVYVNVAPVGPAITATNPASPIPTGSYTVTISGTGFATYAEVMESGVVISTTVVNSTTLKVQGYHGPAGPSSFQVMNPGTLWGPPFNVTFATAGPPPPQTISPVTASVNLGATQQFTSSGATGWSATAGTISSNGLFTAPSTMPASGKLTVKATGPGGTASAIVTLINPNPQTIAPASVLLNLGATQQFSSSGATGWAAVYGSITTAGLYTAPASLPASGSDTVTVTGPNGTATAAVTLIPPTPMITGVGPSNQLPLGIFSASVMGSGFGAQTTAQLNGTPFTTSYTGGILTVSGFYGHSGPANLVLSNGSVSSQPFSVQVGVPNALVSSAAARRFLEQAAFGATPSDATHVQTIGFQAWINEQFAMPQYSNYSSLAGQSQGGMPQVFLANAVTNPDQLRQKVAFALSQIFVVSFQVTVHVLQKSRRRNL